MRLKGLVRGAIDGFRHPVRDYVPHAKKTKDIAVLGGQLGQYEKGE
jgi:hypothetical protein